MRVKIVILFIISTIFVGCVNQNARVLEGGNQVELRSMQSRSFDTSDKNMVVRTVIATLQDLSFVIDKADADLGTISGTKLGGYQIKMTVTVRPKSSEQIVVRSNAQYNLRAIEDPEIYQNFFNSLQKALFLTAHSIE